MNKVKAFLSSFRQAVLALFIFTIVLGVPVFSMVKMGASLYVHDPRSAEPLAALQARPVDATAPGPRLFAEPLISVTFDDGHESIFSVAMPILQKHGIRTTQYVLSGTADDPAYVSWEQMAAMQKAGHDIACHTVDHANLTTLDAAALDRQLDDCKHEMSKRFGPVHDFASPYGAYNDRTLQAIQTRYTSHRNTLGTPSDGVDAADINVAGNFDRMNIIAITIRSDTTVDQLKQLVDFARKHNGWLVLTYHQANDPTSEYSVTTKQLEEQLGYLSRTDVRIVTVQDVLKNQPKHEVRR